MSKEIDYIGEGSTDDAIARKLIQAVDAIPGISRRNPVRGNGKQSLDRRIRGLNAGLVHGARPILLLRDLDQDAKCPSTLVKKLIDNAHPHLFLRICVKTAESWLLADAKNYSDYCGVAVGKIPLQLDENGDLKQLITSWKSHSVKIRRHFVSASKRGLSEWATVAEWNISFIEDHWDPSRAVKTGRSRSLERAFDRLQAFAALDP